jgi:hypothetical protein
MAGRVGEKHSGVASAAAALLCSRGAGSVRASERDSTGHRGWEDEAVVMRTAARGEVHAPRNPSAPAEISQRRDTVDSDSMHGCR